MKRYYIYCDGQEEGGVWGKGRCSHLYAEGLDIKCAKGHEFTDDPQDFGDCPDGNEDGPWRTIHAEILITFK